MLHVQSYKEVAASIPLVTLPDFLQIIILATTNCLWHSLGLKELFLVIRVTNIPPPVSGHGGPSPRVAALWGCDGEVEQVVERSGRRFLLPTVCRCPSTSFLRYRGTSWTIVILWKGNKGNQLRKYSFETQGHSNSILSQIRRRPDFKSVPIIQGTLISLFSLSWVYRVFTQGVYILAIMSSLSYTNRVSSLCVCCPDYHYCVILIIQGVILITQGVFIMCTCILSWLPLLHHLITQGALIM